MRHAVVRGLVGLLALVFVSGMVVVPSTVAGADPIPIVCDAFNNPGVEVAVNPITGIASWTVRGSGVCSGGFPANPSVDFSGTGTSTGAGLCSGDAAAQDLNLKVTAVFTFPERTVTQQQTWSLPLTTYPGAVEFRISGPASGVGTAFTRIFLKCPGSGNDTARFFWAQTI